MNFGHLRRPDSYTHLALPSAIEEALREMRRIRYWPSSAEERIDLRGDDMYLLHRRFHPAPRSARAIESHIKYADIHLCLAGKVTIDFWPSLDLLEVSHPYDTASDSFLYRERQVHSPTFSPLQMIPESFAIFFKNQAHRSGVGDHVTDEVNMVVAKVSMALLTRAT